mgnify:CR=1 FL=1
MSQRRSSPCGLFSRAEDKLKLSDDVINEALPITRQCVELYFTRVRNPLGVLPHESPIRLPESRQLFIRIAQRNAFRRRDVRQQSDRSPVGINR